MPNSSSLGDKEENSRTGNHVKAIECWHTPSYDTEKCSAWEERENSKKHINLRWN